MMLLGTFTVLSVLAFTQAVGARSRCDGLYKNIQVGSLTAEFAPPYLYENGYLCGVENGCLKEVAVDHVNDTDRLGQYFEDRCSYLTYSYASVTFSTRAYEDGTLVFKQEFPSGLPGASMGDKDGVSTAFPRIKIPSSTEVPGLRYFTPGGYMIGWTKLSIGSVAEDMDNFRYGEDGGLVVLFQENKPKVNGLAMSALTQPMATNVWLDKNSSTLDWGIQGQAELIPKEFSLEIILHPNLYSINSLIMEWGGLLQKYHATVKKPDPSSRFLNYYTDNGAYYYYNTGDYSNYRDALMSVYNYTLDTKLPIRHLELDSWWYYKGLGDGVKNWTEIPSVIPDGIGKLHEATGWPIVAHNRYFASNTDYAQQNGGLYPFTIDNGTQKALPLDKSFWDGLFDRAKGWGLTTYIQDWLNEQYSETSALHTNLTLGNSWLDNMGQSAEERGINIMYCMSYMRHILHTVTTPAVTQARASDDYKATHDQWRIGVTSLVSHSLGLLPFKDVFWSAKENSDEPFSNSQLGKDVFTEPNPYLQGAVASLSGGSVGPGDKAENLDVDLLMRSCNKDGFLLHPTKPLTAIDKYFFSTDFKEVWTGYSVIDNHTFGIIFLEDIKSNLNLTAYELNLEEALASNVTLWQNYPLNPTYIKEVASGDAISLPKCEGSFTFCLYYTSPALYTEKAVFYLLGEKAKWVPVSAQRITDVTATSDDVSVTVRGVEGEQVVISFYETSVFDITCDFATNGIMKISLSSRKCQAVKN